MSAANKSRTSGVWQRGPIAGYAPQFQPVVHALLDVIEEIELEASDLTHAQLWARPGGVASIGFHIVHVAGSTDRLFTYALDEPLTEAQRDYLRSEADVQDESVSATALIARMAESIRHSLSLLSRFSPDSYHAIRYVGRARIESTVWGLIFHATEHASRHAGQLVTTSRIVRSQTAP